LFLKGGILRSGNNIQDRLCDLRKHVHFCAKGLHGFNEGKKSGKGDTHVSPATKDERITPKRASDNRFIGESGVPPDKVPGENFFDYRVHHVLNREEVLRGEWVHD